LTTYGLTALFPLAHCKLEVSLSIQEDQSAEYILEWINSHVSNDTRSNEKFAPSLLGAILSQFKAIKGHGKEPSPELIQKEEELMKNYAPLLLPFMTPHNEVALLTEAHAFFSENGLAKGLIARIFEYLYTNKLVTSRAISQWMEITLNTMPLQEEALSCVKGWWDKFSQEEQ